MTHFSHRAINNIILNDLIQLVLWFMQIMKLPKRMYCLCANGFIGFECFVISKWDICTMYKPTKYIRTAHAYFFLIFVLFCLERIHWFVCIYISKCLCAHTVWTTCSIWCHRREINKRVYATRFLSQFLTLEILHQFISTNENNLNHRLTMKWKRVEEMRKKNSST